MRAILSDVHGNLEALEAVLHDVADHGADEIYCLGDVVGYGPSPLECLEISLGWTVVLLGNHDQGVLFDPDGFGVTAERAIFWHRTVLEAARRDDLWEFLAVRPRSHVGNEGLFVHGSPRSSLDEYVFPEDVGNERKMVQIGRLIDHVCFNGHTHVPGVFVEEEVGRWTFHAPAEINHLWRLDRRKTIVNVGSVGQPRDGDWRACYVLLDGNEITFRRVPYDVDTTVRKIYAIPELADFLGDRLREGR
jgi:diadenosine tetraphosphatase ApaH/serine/threonine PP2A family protein phosphatase